MNANKLLKYIQPAELKIILWSNNLITNEVKILGYEDICLREDGKYVINVFFRYLNSDKVLHEMTVLLSINEIGFIVAEID